MKVMMPVFAGRQRMAQGNLNKMVVYISILLLHCLVRKAYGISSSFNMPPPIRLLQTSNYTNQLNFTLQTPPSDPSGVLTYIVLFNEQQVIASLLKRPYIFMGQFPKTVADDACRYIASTNQTLFYANFEAYGIKLPLVAFCPNLVGNQSCYHSQYTDYALDLSGIEGCAIGQEQIVLRSTNQTFGVVCGQFPYMDSCALYVANAAVTNAYCQPNANGARDITCGSCDHYARPSDICASIAAEYGITIKQLYALNPAIDSMCKNLYPGQKLQVCISCPSSSYAPPNSTSIPYIFAPYVYLGDSTALLTPAEIINASSSARIGEMVLSFVTASSATGCQAVWNMNASMPASGPNAWNTSSFQSSGVSLAIAFSARHKIGSSHAHDLCHVCSDSSELAVQYQAVIDTYKPVRLDFDIGPLANNTNLNKMIAALVQIQTNNPAVKLSLSVPATHIGVSPSIQSTLKRIVDSNLVFKLNIAMGYEGSNSSTSPGVLTTQATEAVIGNLQLLYPCATRAQLYTLVIITVIIGYNSHPAPVFGLDDAQVLTAYASTNGVAGVSMWSLNRDRPCSNGYSERCSGINQTDYAFSNILQGTSCRYTVQRGDQCYSIAGIYGMTTAQLLVLNPLLKKDCSNLYVGQVLQVCYSCIYTVEQGDTCNAICAAFGISLSQLYALNPSINSVCTNLQIDQVLRICPIKR